ncbi:MAG: pirin family protein [Sneathiellaceae bacterium]
MAELQVDRARGLRPVLGLLEGMPAEDGAGVKLSRVIGQPRLDMLDPFLLLDSFRSDMPGDYIAGFPAHPHRGFETVTYLLDGRLRHEDSVGNAGVIESGGIQWMTAGRGIIHSEMPEQKDGLLWGFQLWVNLPGRDKMSAPRYQEFDAGQIPVETRQDGTRVKVITGRTGSGTEGPVRDVAVAPLYFDVTVPPGGSYGEDLPAGHTAFLFGIAGSAGIAGPDGNAVRLAPEQLAVLGPGDRLELTAGGEGARFLLVAGRPLGEPVARGGPFVMNSRAELMQAFQDYQSGRFLG